MVNLSNDIPDIYYICKEKFGVDWNNGIIFTYGNTIYSKDALSQDLIIHELTHVEQQEKTTPIEWWSKYLNDPTFRLSQELEAYRNQLRYLRTAVKDRNKLTRMTHHICTTLSGSIYGNIITFIDAWNKLK